MKKSYLFDTLILIVFFAGAGYMLYAGLTGGLDGGVAFGILIGMTLVFGLLLWLKNYASSAYGGRFARRYPDAKE